MFDEKDHDRNDALGQRLQRIGGQMNPSPELKKAAKTGVPLRRREETIPSAPTSANSPKRCWYMRRASCCFWARSC